MEIFHLQCKPLQSKYLHQQKYGLATSTYFIGLDIGIGFGPSVLGMFTNTISYSSIYLLMALVSTITIVIYFVIHGRKVKHLTPN